MYAIANMIRRFFFHLKFVIQSSEGYYFSQKNHVSTCDELREHIHRTYSNHSIFLIHQSQITSLCSRVTTYIDHFFQGLFTNLFNYIFVHSISWRICNHYIWMSMLCNERIIENNFHISNEKFAISDIVLFSICFCINNRFRNTFNTDYFLAFLETNCAIVPVRYIRHI